MAGQARNGSEEAAAAGDPGLPKGTKVGPEQSDYFLTVKNMLASRGKKNERPR